MIGVRPGSRRISRKRVVNTRPSSPDSAAESDTFVEGTLHAKVQNRMIQKRYRQRAKQKRDSLEDEVSRMKHKIVRIEEKKAHLEAHVTELRIQSERLRTVENTSGVVQPNLLANAAVEFIPAVTWAGFNPAGKTGLVLTAICQPPKKLSHDLILSWDIQHFAVVLKEMVFEIGKLMLTNPSESLDSVDGVKLKAVLDERKGLCCYVGCWAEKLVHLYYTRNLDTMEERPDSSTTENDTDRIARLLNVSESQKAGLSRTWTEFRNDTTAILQSRKQLATDVLEIDEAVEESDMTWQNEASKRDILDQLRENIEKEAMELATLWASCLYKPNGFTRFQEATMIMNSWPYQTDITSIAHRIHMQNEDQQGRVGRMSDDTSGTEISESEKDPEHLPAKIAGNLVKKDVSPHIEGFVEAFTKFKIETKQV